MNYWLKIDNPEPSLYGSVRCLEMTQTILEDHHGIRVLDSGVGEGGTPWLAVADPSPTIAALREKLGATSQYVIHIEPIVHVAQGHTLARQLPLFH